ncbi:sporulation peptidase YabG [Aquibacillus sp. 3ASR75-11]|uniref:Sporulation peptidase YabG n=1 Tax=Terrihalobacillus insolitus TaxID=2950438 RepID=A0A9X4ANP1_9BACI|nr:sporulation peptidase YabG [Terrihalobacillus insolitus]MDC3414875.1 sporulation peptidase YabG [Terrihalobacillus insolitus]MDC3426024.1 sporulation peptidase YabG [Terrihalobacillus insolitus]
MEFTVGELVTRSSYNHDILFRISNISNDTLILHGEDFRLEADANQDDLVKIEERDLKKRKKQSKEKEDYSFRLFRQDYQLMKEKREYESTSGYYYPSNYFQIPARVLHLDGDRLFLRKCINLYQRLGLQVHGVHLDEKEMPTEIGALVEKIQPDIIVITGHDAFSRNKGTKSDIRAYRHSKYFAETVREARKKIPNLDQLVIFAGACQSHFESLIRAGANFASSPSRINIHALDPVYIAAKVAYTPFMEKLGVWETLRNTMTGEKGLGGLETRGLLRTGMPYMEENELTNEE